jgi:hypothetical protein
MIGLWGEGKSSPDALRRSAGAIHRFHEKPPWCL